MFPNMAQPHRASAYAVLTVSAVALCVVLPFLGLGIPSGHDFEFHFNSWIEVTEHWKQGEFYPRWAAMAHYGYGEARFIFYPPLSWTLGALLGSILPWKLVPAAFVWLVLTLAGYAMFALARNYLPVKDAIFAAALYAANPYSLVIVYWRSAWAELIVAAYLPLILLLLVRADEKDNGRGIVIPLSLLVAAGWLTNLPGAVMMNYSLAALAAVVALRGRSSRVLFYVAGAIVLGAMLAGFYLLPAFHQQKWVDIEQVLAPGVRPVDNFLFRRTDDLDHNRFNVLVSIVAAFEIAVTAVAILAARRSQSRKLWSLVVAWGVLCALLMLKPTLPLWLYLPKLRFVQLPWRWLLCLGVPFALAATWSVRNWRARALLCAAVLAVILLVWHRVQVPWWDNAADIKEMVDNQYDGVGNEGTDEYVPIGADSYDIDRNAPLVRFDGEGSAQIQILRWYGESRQFLVNSSAPGSLTLRLFNYPSWKVRINGEPVPSGRTPHTGQMTIPVAAGKSLVQINFADGWDRAVGIACSAVAAIALLTSWLTIRRRTGIRLPARSQWAHDRSRTASQ
jgi:hypothetical protein